MAFDDSSCKTGEAPFEYQALNCQSGGSNSASLTQHTSVRQMLTRGHNVVGAQGPSTSSLTYWALPLSQEINHTELYSLACKMGELKPAAEDPGGLRLSVRRALQPGFSTRLIQQTGYIASHKLIVWPGRLWGNEIEDGSPPGKDRGPASAQSRTRSDHCALGCRQKVGGP